MSKLSLLFAAAALAGALSAGCSRSEPTPAMPRVVPLEIEDSMTVVAPKVLERPLRDMHERMGDAGRNVVLETRVIDELLAELEKGTLGGDVLLMPRGPALAAATKSLGLDGEPEGKVAGMIAVVTTSKGSGIKVKALSDLAQPQVESIAVPDAAYDAAGRLFLHAVAAAGLMEQIEDKLQTVPSPRAAMAAVTEGEAHAGVSYLPAVMFGKESGSCSIACFLPKDGPYAADVVGCPMPRGKEALAQAYLDALTSDEAQAVLACSGFQRGVPRDRGEAATHLLIPCGAGLQPAMDEVGRVYYERTGVRPDFSYAGSGMLLATLDFTHEGDLYMPGEAFWVVLAERRDLVADTRAVVYFTPVLCFPEGNPGGIESLADIAKPGVRVAIGDPQALAVGPVTQRILERAGIKDAVHDNVVMRGGCIPELANCIAMRGADACILWDAVAEQHADKMDWIELDPEVNEVAEVLLATLSCSSHPEEAAEFMDFVASDEAAAIFEQQGFRTEAPEGIRLAPREGPDV